MKFLFTLLFMTQFSFAHSINVHYSASADIFEIMDNVSQWWPGFNDEAYQEFWIKKFGVSQLDKEFFKEYQKIRQKYYNDPDQSEKDPLKNRNGFFSTLGSISADPVAEAFYSSSNLENVFKKLNEFISEDEIIFLKKYYVHFEHKYLILTQESQAFSKIIQATKEGINKKGLKRFLKDVSKFYGVSANIDYNVLFVWWPPISRTNASPTGNYLIMRYNPLMHSDNSDTDIVMHEVSHTISAQMLLEDKVKYTNSFIEICDVRKYLKKLKILEEPLAVATGQMLYQSRFQPKRFNYADKWYNDVWISMFAKLIYPIVKNYVDQGRTIDSDFIKMTASMCKEVKEFTESATKN